MPENWNKFDPNKDVVLTNQVTVKGHYNRNFSTDGFVFRDPGNRDKGPLDVERSNNYNLKTPFTKEEMWQRSGAIETDHTLEAIFIPLPKIVGLLRAMRFWKLAKQPISRIEANSLKEFKALVQKLSNPSSKLTKKELTEFEKLTEQFGGKLRYDLNPVKGKNLQPVEGLGKSVESRHIWIE